MTEGRVTLVDGILAVAVRAGLALNAVVGSWWAGRVALAASAVAFGVLALLDCEKHTITVIRRLMTRLATSEKTESGIFT
jgi:hypothetical protein